ncbi:MAG TPA: hypothetical protein VKZ98_11750 [Aquaticitalea sp.]|nr:hypothetical protein [Aquaticitalea sp.]
MIFVFAILLLQCGPDYQTNKRVLIKGQLQNHEGEPIGNIDVSAFTLTEDYLQGNQQNGYLLGRNQSQVDGSIAVVCLIDVESDFFIRVKGGDDFIDYSYVFKTDLSDPENLVVDMGNIILQKRAEVTFNLTRTSSMDSSIEYIVSYQNTICYEVYGDDNLIAEESSCYEQLTLSNTLEGSTANFTNVFNSILGANFTLTYSINNEPEITETFSINQPNSGYEFTY